MSNIVSKCFIWLFFSLPILNSCTSELTPNKTLDARIDARILVQPYLQLATPTSIYIKWETDVAIDGLVLWGLSEKLDQSTPASRQSGFGSSAIHQAQLTNLSPNSVYHYQVKTGNSVSKVYQFKTPPRADSEQSTRILAMSDMQFDSHNPNKFQSVINEGVLPYIKNVINKPLHLGLDMVVIPGDLVDNAKNYPEWRHTFFTPIAPLAAQVPLYPVAGNHEYDQQSYFNFFTLPINGSKDYLEHWYYHDLSNVRVIGLDTNENYRLDIQLQWLDKLLTDTCTNKQIDFVFAQMHHPHKSELWLAGELGFSGKIVAKLEQFSTNCRKPSIHFFGHTHGYSRGVSRDHSHAMINVASAGGNLDSFGEYPQQDYKEFSISQDQYGFVMVDVSAGDKPSFTIKRLSMGDSKQSLKHQLTDSLTVRKFNNKPETPQILSLNNKAHKIGNLIRASEFVDEDNDLFGAAHWQLIEHNCNKNQSCGKFDKPLIDTWYQHQNIWAGFNTQKDKPHNQITFKALRAGTFADDIADKNNQYCVRVRYRDRALAWSEWSQAISFTVTNANLTANLLKNGDAEQGITHWQPNTAEDHLESLTSGQCDGINAYKDNKYFVVGGICNNTNERSEVFQRVALSQYKKRIIQGKVKAHFSGVLRNFNGNDKPELLLRFRDKNLNLIASSENFYSLKSHWTLTGDIAKVPTNTQFIDFVLKATRNAGKDNDSYFDDLVLQLDLNNTNKKGDD